MTLQSDTIPGASEELNAFTESVRLFLRDYSDLNRLIDGEESNPRMIAFAAMDAISEFNSEPPPLRKYNFGDFISKGWTSFLLKGTVKHLLQSIALLQNRNNLRFSDGGITAQTSDKASELMNFSQVFERQWKDWVKKIKITENISSILSNGDGAASEYSLLHGYNYYSDSY